MKAKLFETIEGLQENIIKDLGEIISVPAISPSTGGKGEYAKVQVIKERMKALGFPSPEEYNAPDERAEKGIRPSLVYRFKGKTEKRLWFVTHTDVVPTGELKLWETAPFTPVYKNGCLYGRGTSDNGQELIASAYAALALIKAGLTPEYEVCLCFVADEEVGSQYGISYLIKQGLFSSEDLVVVPDAGTEEGDFIEIAEKSLFWIEFTVQGRQVHASMPHLGINACRVANEFSYRLDEALHKAFPEENKLFSPAVSTFEPTKRNANVPNINTVPGRESFCFDCRVLPGIAPEEIDKVIDAEIKKICDRTGAEITYVYHQKECAPEPTPADAPVVVLIKDAAEQVLPVKTTIGGVGGGTCAAHFRRNGIPAVVWTQEEDVAHMPNEYAKAEHILNEAKVFALMMLGGKEQ